MQIAPAKCPKLKRDMWSVNGKEKTNYFSLTGSWAQEWLLNSLWQLDIGGYKNHIGYVTLTPHKVTAKNGQQIGYSILVLTKVPDANETLQQFFR